MRKYDIFGKKISQIKFVYSLVVVFLIAIAGYFLVINIQQNRLYELINPLTMKRSKNYFPLFLPILINIKLVKNYNTF